MMKPLILVLHGVLLVAAVTMQAQQGHNATKVDVRFSADRPHRTVTGKVERTTEVINYRKQSDVTKVRLRGTALLPDARGETKIQRKQGQIEIVAKFDGLQSATRFGPEYLTYIVWAITPEGCARNLGEVVPNGMKSDLTVATDSAVFGLIVTAEPYFAVSQPSEVVVMENVFSEGSVGKEQPHAKYELLPRGSYTANVSQAEVKPIVVNPNTPLDLYEARNALWIALWAGAHQNAAELFAKAERSLHRAEVFHASRAGAKAVLIAARDTVRMAENARMVALKHTSESRLSREKAAVCRSTIAVE